MSARLLLLGLDAFEATALAGGEYPTLDGLTRAGAVGTIVGNHRTLTDTVWPELRTGMSGSTSGIYFQPSQFRSGEERSRALRPDELWPDRLFWNVAAAAGHRVLVSDMPLAPQSQRTDITEIGSWGTHDRPFTTFATAGLAQQAIAAAGTYPIWVCNATTRAERDRLPSNLHRGADMKTEMYSRLLAADSWDLFTATFSEAHCAGHHFWPPEEAGHLTSIYRHLDESVGSLLTQVDDDTTVIVYTSHGMRPSNDGVFMVAEVLARMGMVTSNRRRRRISALVPERLRPAVRRMIGSSALAKAGFTFDRAITDGRAIPLPNSHHGAIRLALAGRDPGGSVEPGSSDHDELIDELRRAFTGLRLPAGGPAVSDFVLMDELFGAGRNPDLPDIVIRFREDVGLIPECHSDELGVLRSARASHRTGEHGMPGSIWARGPGITPGTRLGDIRTIDFAPTVLALLGIEPKPWMEGTPVPGLL